MANFSNKMKLVVSNPAAHRRKLQLRKGIIRASEFLVPCDWFTCTWVVYWFLGKSNKRPRSTTQSKRVCEWKYLVLIGNDR